MPPLSLQVGGVTLPDLLSFAELVKTLGELNRNQNIQVFSGFLGGLLFVWVSPSGKTPFSPSLWLLMQFLQRKSSRYIAPIECGRELPVRTEFRCLFFGFERSLFRNLLNAGRNGEVRSNEIL